MRLGIALLVATLLGSGTFYAATSPPTLLSITVYPKGINQPGAKHYTLRCDPTGGTVQNPARACRVLARLAHPFAPVPPRTICTDIALGPQEATVTGRLRGNRVRAHLTLRNGCEIDRWRRLASVVPGFPLGG